MGFITNSVSRCMAGIPLSRNFAAGKGGSLAGRLFAGTLSRLQVGRSPDWLKFKLHWRCGERPASHKRSGTGGARTGIRPDALPYWGDSDEAANRLPPGD